MRNRLRPGVPSSATAVADFNGRQGLTPLVRSVCGLAAPLHLRPSPPPKWHMCSASSVAAVQKSDVDVVRYTATQVSKLTPQLTFLKSQHEGEILRTQIYLACLPDILNTPTQPNHHHQSPPKASHLAAGSIQIAREG